LEEKVAAPVKKTEINDRGDPLRWSRDTLYPQMLSLTSPTSANDIIALRLSVPQCCSETSRRTDNWGTETILLGRLSRDKCPFCCCMHGFESQTDLSPPPQFFPAWEKHWNLDVSGYVILIHFMVTMATRRVYSLK
jgi:hypothetical protein